MRERMAEEVCGSGLAMPDTLLLVATLNNSWWDD